MSTEIERLVDCPHCEGCGTVWETLKGANIQRTQPCYHCLGMGRVYRPMTKGEKKALAEKLLKEDNTPSPV